MAVEVTKIYENQSLTVTARIERSDVESIEEVTFKFLKNGEQIEEKTIPIAEGKHTAGETTVSHAVKAPAVADDKTCYFLDYHYFYKIKNPDASTESLQNFPASRIQVFPRVAQLKVTDGDGKAFPDFQFMVEQDGQCSEVRKTVAIDTPNAQGESVPAGSCEFNLDLFDGFRIVPVPPYKITEDLVGTGRKREVKGAIGFRARFVAPQKSGSTRYQYVNYEIESDGQTGIGHAVTIEVGVHPEDAQYLSSVLDPAVHFRVTYGPDAAEPVAKSKRDDADHPTKVTKASDADISATIDEKEASKKYEGKVVLADGFGKFVVGLGKAGGDTCKVEISGTADFLTDKNRLPDATLDFENWRRVHYELMVPDLLREQLDWRSSDFKDEAKRLLDKLGRDLFIEFVHDKTNVFDAVAYADEGTLLPRRFVRLQDGPDPKAYVLSGRNWRKLPREQAWAESHLGKSLYIALCDSLYKWRKDTDDEQAGTTDFSGTLTEAVGRMNVQEKFQGCFMPFSGYDGDEGIKDIDWAADITKEEAGVKFTPELVIEEERHENRIGNILPVQLSVTGPLPAQPETIEFHRPHYPGLRISDKTTAAASDEADDGKVTIKETALGKELVLKFELVPAAETGSQEGEDVEPTDPAEVTADHMDKLYSYFEELFKDGKDKLRASDKSNWFNLEVHGKTRPVGTAKRFEEATWAVRSAYANTKGHDQHKYLAAELGDAQTKQIQNFVDALLADKTSLRQVKAKAAVRLSCASEFGTGEDDCFKAVKAKLQELFDATKTEFVYHPGLDDKGEPRTGAIALLDITDKLNSTVDEWHFVLPQTVAGGKPGPGSFVAPVKSAEKCPVKIGFSVQPHETSPGEADGKLIAWACGYENAAKHLISLVLQGFQGSEDAKCLEHGHGEDGVPGLCLIDGTALCEKCVAYGRSRNLTVISDKPAKAA